MNEKLFINKDIVKDTVFGNFYATRQSVAEKLKISHHYNDTTVSLKNGDLYVAFKVGGISFYTEDFQSLRTFNVRFHNWLRDIAKYENLIIRTHLIRSKVGVNFLKESSSKFSQYLDEKYQEKLNEKDLFRNDFYITLQIKPSFDNLGVFRTLFKKVDKQAYFQKISETAKELNDVVVATKAYLGDVNNLDASSEGKASSFRIKQLGVYEEEGVKYSEIAEFESFLMNNKKTKIPLKSACLSNSLSTSKIMFNKDFFEVDPLNRNKFVGGALGIKQYPSELKQNGDALDRVLNLPFECSISQSFQIINKHKALSLVRTRMRKMDQAADVGYEEREELEFAQQHFQNGSILLGKHNINCFVYAEKTSQLRKNISQASSALSLGGGVISREGFANEAAFWARFGGNESLSPRLTPIPSNVFASISSFHTFPIGKKEENHWGDALTVFKNNGGSPYYFNWHVKDIGNSLIIGPTGSGKTVLQGFIIAQTEKQNIKTVFIDKDRGGEIMCRALGGSYQTLIQGEPSGFAPLKIFCNNPETFNEELAWLIQFVEMLVTAEGQSLSPSKRKHLSDAIRLVVKQPVEQRNFGTLLVQLNDEELRVSLEEWSVKGVNGWLFDNEADTFSSDTRLLGMDITSILDNERLSSAFTMYLFKRIEYLIDGNPIQIIFDEFWKSLANEKVASFINDKLKVIRKQNGAVIGGTQSAQDILNSPISHSILEQCKTKILFPNESASKEAYIDGLGCTEREFTLLKEDLIGSRFFLVKRENYSVVCSLDLGGLDGVLKVLSGRVETINELNSLMKELGSEDPNIWLSEFIGEN